ncbi:hypothetical protein SKAU_G00388770 [Synaphobranchus kaupii]|uniref:Carboxylic ester hydrolase n=1 Tax=Synaphobranchus kaupii TaxID=118154 RepID=A0A9Q1ICK0_SYNKA|nr:hypothetical protein SKAU_G00388770 [Synaphobranchus kaupii]
MPHMELNEAPVVTVKSGSLRGEYARVKGTENVVERFLGVPFARPPVGPLRFARPQPPLPWEGVRNATREPNMCLQNSDAVVPTAKLLAINHTIPPMSEDCLYLNVYAPSNITTGEKAPVMMWIHGGGLVMGFAAQYDASPLAAYQGVVVVIIQYRLGILGFLSTGDEHAPGNWGFFDQLAALQWIQDNIESFGGDPKSVTIFGESAGGVSVSILMLSPLSTGLFHKAIPQSGVATMSMFSNSDPLSQAKVVANLTGCSHDVTEQLVQCLKLRTEDEIVNVAKKAKGANDLIAQEYLREAQTPEAIRDGFTEMIGDLFIVLPVIKAARYHRDAGVPVYLYEFRHRPEAHKSRPSFVKADHASELGFVFGACFWEGPITVTGSITTEEDELCRTMMAYWANFARTGSPNGADLVQWPVYGETEEYLKLGLEQLVGQKLKQNRVHFMNATLPELLAMPTRTTKL